MGKPESFTEKKALLRKHHEVLLRSLNVNDNQYCPHMSFNHDGEQFMKFFPGEINMKKDLYTESVSRDMKPEDAERHLLVLKYGPHWHKYERLDDKFKMIMVPVADMQPVSAPVKPLELIADYMDSSKDDDISQLTIMDLAAIIWQKPVASKSYLNKEIERLKTK